MCPFKAFKNSFPSYIWKPKKKKNYICIIWLFWQIFYKSFILNGNIMQLFSLKKNGVFQKLQIKSIYLYYKNIEVFSEAKKWNRINHKVFG